MSAKEIMLGYTSNVISTHKHREKNIYISGPMTGLPNYNFEAFNQAADKLKSEGWNVCNPADHGLVDGATKEDYLRHDLAWLSTCSAIYLLPGWKSSSGVKLELDVAKALGMTIIDSTNQVEELRRLFIELYTRCKFKDLIFVVKMKMANDFRYSIAEYVKTKPFVLDPSSGLTPTMVYCILYREWLRRNNFNVLFNLDNTPYTGFDGKFPKEILEMFNRSWLVVNDDPVFNLETKDDFDFTSLKLKFTP